MKLNVLPIGRNSGVFSIISPVVSLKPSIRITKIEIINPTTPIAVNIVSSRNDRIQDSRIRGTVTAAVTVTRDTPNNWPQSSPSR